MTLIELTVIIITLLTMISVLFIGTAAYKEGTDRASCILNQRNVQTYVRSYQNMWDLNIGDDLDPSDIFGETAFLATQPECPAGGIYTLVDTIPEIGTLAFTCEYADARDHEPSNHGEW
ncbi:hypothetical protein [Sulfuriroseicoccus oceanibius]|uniref:Type II secretion system protein n=1 Tax=Sulfuriroseicoccus oceanibius TaxID=2707525 RepID=A0A6B3LCV8_9BACT|nr:hypothetical protein [Sulfuriroseicoccus oceanibius]QQL45801.1 hypothetical protein G3M56_004245 [Sulfuriroseicoccus oceanibius]